jgi:hypothetical protein
MGRELLFKQALKGGWGHKIRPTPRAGAEARNAFAGLEPEHGDDSLS